MKSNSESNKFLLDAHGFAFFQLLIFAISKFFLISQSEFPKKIIKKIVISYLVLSLNNFNKSWNVLPKDFSRLFLLPSFLFNEIKKIFRYYSFFL